ncbi:MAG: ABC transporter substrate-binding protein [Acidobacteriota bacterium]
MKAISLVLPFLSMLLFPQEKILYDDFNYPFAPAAQPQRIISLTPNITEILFGLGLGSRVVGVTRYCDYPPEAAAKEKIGGMVDPNLEKIQALRPDLIFAFRGNPLGILNKLRNLRFPVFVLNQGVTLKELFLTIEKIGRVTREEKPAAALLESLRKEYAATRAALQKAESRPKVFLSVYGQGLWTCGKESYLNDLLIQAGGINIAGQIPRRWLQLNREQLIHENPDVIIIMAKDQDRFAQTRKALLADSRLGTIRAVEKGRIHFLNEDRAGRFGPRLITALGDVARILHPEKFRGPE